MRSRSITSTVFGTSAMARSVRVAVTTMRSSSVASCRGGTASAGDGGGGCALAPSIAARRAERKESKVGRIADASLCMV